MTKKHILLLTPPLLQPNTPYPATPHLKGFLEAQGFRVTQCDLSIKVVRDVLLKYGDETTDELLEFLGGPAPSEAKREASAVIEELAERIRREIDSDFGFSRYAEHLCVAVRCFADLEKRVRRRGVIDEPLLRHLKRILEETRPDVIGVTCPFPGTLVGAFKIARYVRRQYPKIRLMLGGGFVNTELRELKNPKAFRYFDEFVLDDPKGMPPFVRPSYEGIDWNDYFDIVETDNFVSNLWNTGKWVKLIMARGCYWHRCAFCDVRLPYIGCFQMPKAAEIVDAIEALCKDQRLAGVHFVDEAMPPKLVNDVCDELLRRKIEVAWWGNIRFDASFTRTLARKMARAGCVCVTGGLECANDRLLSLMSKGITCASAEKVLRNFHAAEIFVHAYLMYDFPTETPAEYRGAQKYVRRLAREGLIQSCFWHRFALTVHSPIAREPEKFGIIIRNEPSDFARNELDYKYAH